MSAEPSAGEAVKFAGAVRLLDRDAPADYLREWTERVAAEKKSDDAGTLSAVVFRIGEEWLALPTALLQEVAEECVLHTIPHRGGGAVAGLVNVRGELLICVSLGAALGIDAGAEHDARAGGRVFGRLLVAEHRGHRLAFPVDEVGAVQRYHPRDLRPAPATLAERRVKYTTGLLVWRERTAGVLEGAELFENLNSQLA